MWQDSVELSIIPLWHPEEALAIAVIESALDEAQAQWFRLPSNLKLSFEDFHQGYWIGQPRWLVVGHHLARIEGAKHTDQLHPVVVV